jgi:hypothetical protein
MTFFVYLIGSILLLVFPIALVVFNSGFSARAKLVGTLASLFFSWLGFIVFFLMMAIQKRAIAR